MSINKTIIEEIRMCKDGELEIHYTDIKTCLSKDYKKPPRDIYCQHWVVLPKDKVDLLKKILEVETNGKN